MKIPEIRVAGSFIAAGDATIQPGSQFYTFPSLCRCFDGSYLLSVRSGAGKTSADGRIEVYRSRDQGRSWAEAGSPVDGWASTEQMMCHITQLDDLDFIAVLLTVDRNDPDAPLFHPQTDGMQHTDVWISRSSDGGRNWSGLRPLGYSCPDLLVPGKIHILTGGVLALPCEIWHQWDRGFVDGPASPLVLSRDGGESWNESVTLAKDIKKESIFGDPRVSQAGNHLVVLFWKHNFKEGKDRPVHISRSADGGVTWSVPENTGISGQIANPFLVENGGLWCIYQKRSGDPQGLYAVFSPDFGRSWDPATVRLIWEAEIATENENPFAAYQGYYFGYSTLTRISSDSGLLTFWRSNGRTTCIEVLHLEMI